MNRDKHHYPIPATLTIMSYSMLVGNSSSHPKISTLDPETCHIWDIERYHEAHPVTEIPDWRNPTVTGPDTSCSLAKAFSTIITAERTCLQIISDQALLHRHRCSGPPMSLEAANKISTQISLYEEALSMIKQDINLHSKLTDFTMIREVMSGKPGKFSKTRHISSKDFNLHQGREGDAYCPYSYVRKRSILMADDFYKTL